MTYLDPYKYEKEKVPDKDDPFYHYAITVNNMCDEWERKAKQHNAELAYKEPKHETQAVQLEFTFIQGTT